MGQGFFEGDDAYQQRMSKEANEQRIEEATGGKPSQGFFESDDAYRSRITDEAHKSTIESLTGENPAQGLFESDSAYRYRIAQEAHKAILIDSTDEKLSQGLFESDDEYSHRLRHKANEANVRSATGNAPKQGLFESDKDYRGRVSLEAREQAAKGRKSDPIYVAPGGTSANRGSGGAFTQGGSSTLLWIAAIVGLFLVITAIGGTKDHQEGVANSESQTITTRPVADSRWISEFRARLAEVASGSARYDQGEASDLLGEIDVNQTDSEPLRQSIIDIAAQYDAFSDPGSCEKAVGPLNQTDIAKLLSDKIAFVRNPISGKQNQEYFLQSSRIREDRICHNGGVTCSRVYACMDNGPRLFVGGVSDNSDDEIIAIAKPRASYFEFGDFGFVVTDCRTPEATFRSVQLRLSPALSNAIFTDRSLALDVLSAVSVRAANLCPIREKRPLLDPVPPISNMEVSALDASGNEVFNARSDGNGNWR